MVGVVADYLKARRHRRGSHVLFIGSGATVPPDEYSLAVYLRQLAAETVHEEFTGLPAEQRLRAQLEAFAQSVPDPGERAKRLRAAMNGARPAEGHVRLAGLVKVGYFPAIFTMEPHGLLEQALRNNFLEPGTDYHLLVLGQDPPEVVGGALQHSTRVTVVKCGGDLESRLLPLTEGELTAHLAPYREIISEAFRVLTIFTAYTDRDRPFLRLVPHEGGKIFWVNPTIPLSDQTAFAELRADEPGVAEYHKLEPEVTALMESRQSQRNLLARESGTFNGFFSSLGQALKQHSRRRSLRRGRALSVLRGGPYRFLDYFDVEDSEFFFGREEDTLHLVEMTEADRLAVLFGRSAIGKTSLLRAGLMATLRERDEEYAGEGPRPLLPVYATCGEDPAEQMRQALLTRAQLQGLTLPAEAASQEFPELAGTLAELAEQRVLLIFDNVAGLFVTLGARVREEFVEKLARCQADERALVGERRLHVLISIREDFLGELFELREALPGIMDHMFRLRRLTREQAENAIVKPAANFNLQMERDLVERVLEDLSREGVEPAQLQIVMYRMYELLQTPTQVMTLRLYQQQGGAPKLLTTYLDQIQGQLPVTERPVARAVLRQMTAASELRGRRSLERIELEVGQDREIVERVLAHLVDRRLLRMSDLDRQHYYELVHEYLAGDIKSWLGQDDTQKRDVQDLLTRELNNYQKFGLLMGVEELRILTEHAKELSISPEELELILRSSAVHDTRTDYWYGRLDELDERRDAIVIAFLSDPEDAIRLAAYGHLPSDLTAGYVRVLTNGMEDRLPEVQRLAAKALGSLERQLVSLLESDRPRAKRLAAEALGRLGLRRHAVRILRELSDDDPEYAATAAEALRQLGEQRQINNLSRRLIAEAEPPWALATVLGQLCDDEESATALARLVARQADNPRLLYALALAEMQARAFDAALEHVRRAQTLASDARGRELLEELEVALLEAARRALSGADRWPQFGGDMRHQGRADMVLRPPLRQVWAVRTEGPVVASPVVARGTAYAASRDGRLYAIDSARGTLRWSAPLGGRLEGTPALADQAVYVANTEGRLCALELGRGQPQWRVDLGSAARGGCTLADDLVLAGDVAGNLWAVACDSGRVAWSFATQGELLAAPAVGAGRVLIGSWDAHLYCLDLASGEPRWQTAMEGPIGGAPTLGEGVVWCGADDGLLYACSLADGEVLWRADLGGRVRSTPALAGEVLVVGSGDGAVYGLEATTGAQRWRTATGDEVLASAAVAQEVAYVGSKDGLLYALDCATGEVLWKYTTSFGIYASAALADEALFVGMSYYYVAAFRAED